MIRLVLAAWLLLSGAACAETFTYGIVGNQGSDWIMLIANKKGFFKAEGLEADMISTPSSAAVQQQIAAGSLNFGTGGIFDPVRAIDKGADVTLLRTNLSPPPYALLAKPEIRTLADLKGKTISVGGAQDITRTYLERMLEPSGVHRGQYDLVYAGATAARFAALQSGGVDAAIINAPYNFRAETAGFRSLGLVADFVKDLPFTVISVNRSWGLAHRDTVKRFLAAYEKASVWYNTPENHAEVVDILAHASNTDPADAERSYNFYVAIKAFDNAGTLPPEKVQAVADFLAATGQLEGKAEVSRFVTPGLSVTGAAQ